MDDSTPNSELSPIKSSFLKNLTKEAFAEKFCLFGREKELNQIIEILMRQNKGNPLLLGYPGVGKTAIVKGVAKKIYESRIANLKKKCVYEIFPSQIVAGTKYRGDFEQRMQEIIRKLEKSKAIVFIDEIHMIVKAGASSDDPMDIANILKPQLADGKIKFIGATTFEEYSEYIKKDGALERRFEPIKINPLSEEDTIELIRRTSKMYLDHYGVTFDDEMIKFCVEMTGKYILNRFFPDKAIDVFERSLTRESMSRHEILSKNTILNIIKETSGISIAGGTRRMNEVENIMNRKVIGQEEAISSLLSIVRQYMSGLHDQKKPAGVLLFLGPTGTGKTESARMLSETLFGSENELLILNMADMNEDQSLSRLLGSAPGYVGYDKESSLVMKLQANPFSVILLDEIEKANRIAHNFFLSIFDSGTFNDNKNHKINAQNAIFIMTSNLLEEDLKNNFSPEFLNRIDYIITFNELSVDNVIEITEKQLSEIKENYPVFSENNLDLNIDKKMVEYIATNGYDSRYGVRSIERFIKQNIISIIANAILNESIENVNKVNLKIIDGKVVAELIKEANTHNKEKLIEERNSLFKAGRIIIGINEDTEMDINETDKIIGELRNTMQRGKLKSYNVYEVFIKKEGIKVIRYNIENISLGKLRLKLKQLNNNLEIEVTKQSSKIMNAIIIQEIVEQIENNMDLLSNVKKVVNDTVETVNRDILNKVETVIHQITGKIRLEYNNGELVFMRKISNERHLNIYKEAK